MATKPSDIIAMVSKGIVGAIPVVGPLAAEVIGTIIPNQRIERIESFLHILDEKVKFLDAAKLKDNFTKTESVDLLEDGFYQAARALSDERRHYIASLITNSLTDEQLKHIEYKKLLSILNQLNDIEVLILKSYSLYGLPGHDEFWDKHEEVLMPPSATFGSSREELDKHAIFQTYENHLVELGLLKFNFKKPARGELPEFDEKTGTIKAQGHDITPLGRLLLRSIDQGGEL